MSRGAREVSHLVRVRARARVRACATPKLERDSLRGFAPRARACARPPPRIRASNPGELVRKMSGIGCSAAASDARSSAHVGSVRSSSPSRTHRATQRTGAEVPASPPPEPTPEPLGSPRKPRRHGRPHRAVLRARTLGGTAQRLNTKHSGETWHSCSPGSSLRRSNRASSRAALEVSCGTLAIIAPAR
jgi:hypothetical protein